MIPTVTIIVINYNGEQWISECLDSIFAQSRQPEEVLVVDNASSDHSLALIRTSFPQVKLISLPKNVGFAAACNRGIIQARGDLVAILNNDLALDSRWLAYLLAENSGQWDFWASKILFASEPGRVDSAGDAMAIVGAAYKIGHGDPAGRHMKAREVFGPCAAAALYRRSLLEAVGGFDADFFLIYEDADLNMRARLQGYRCLYVPQAIAFHRLNSAIRTFSHHYVFYGHRNSEYVFWKNMPGTLLFLYLPERIIFNLLSFVFFLFKGRAGSFLQAKVDFVRQFPAVMRKRGQIQQARKLSPAQFRSLLDRNWIKYRRKVLVTD
ncbi:glycosyltransferase family 2 protein [Acidobacteria bacterium AH-259-O06]|nr:glycosyltransferase family 2 protein [Acidobacteria bacterium AH-259-O06]